MCQAILKSSPSATWTRRPLSPLFKVWRCAAAMRLQPGRIFNGNDKGAWHGRTFHLWRKNSTANKCVLQDRNTGGKLCSDLFGRVHSLCFFPGQVRHRRHARSVGVRQTTPPMQDGGRGVGHPGSISHRPLVGGADRPKGRESRRTGTHEAEAVDEVAISQQPTFCLAMWNAWK